MTPRPLVQIVSRPSSYGGEIHFLVTEIAESRSTPTPRWGMARSGYTLRGGAPTSRIVRLAGETRWRRLMVVQVSNSGSCFLRIGGRRVWVDDLMVPDPEAALAWAFAVVGALAWATASDTPRDRVMVARVRGKIEAGDMTGARITCGVLASEVRDPAIRARIDASAARMEAADIESRAFMRNLRKLQEGGIDHGSMTDAEIMGAYK